MSSQETVEFRSIIDCSSNVWVSNSSSHKVQARNGSVNKLVSELRDVVTGVALTRDDERTVLVSVVLLNEFLKELIVTISGSFVAVLGGSAVSRPIRVSNISRGLKVDNVGQLIPVSTEVVKVFVLVSTEGTIFLKKSQKAGASRSSVQPKHQRSSVRVGLSFDQPIKKVLSIVKGDVPRVHSIVGEGAKVGKRQDPRSSVGILIKGHGGERQ